MNSARRLLIPVALLLLALPLAGQRRRDPLTDAETDQLREVADQPEARVKLWVKFVRARMAALDQIRSDPKFAAERSHRTHDLLEDLAGMIDELDDNIDNYSKQKSDIRKGLKDVVEMESELQLKLRGILEATDPASQKELGEYKFVLQNAVESLNQSSANTRDTLQEQNEEFAKKKDKEKDKDKKKEL
jgi:hypothetical protein